MALKLYTDEACTKEISYSNKLFSDVSISVFGGEDFADTKDIWIKGDGGERNAHITVTYDNIKEAKVSVASKESNKIQISKEADMYKTSDIANLSVGDFVCNSDALVRKVVEVKEDGSFRLNADMRDYDDVIYKILALGDTSVPVKISVSRVVSFADVVSSSDSYANVYVVFFWE